MNPTPLATYIQSIRSDNPTTPAMVDERSLFKILSAITGLHMTSYDDLIEGGISSISVYEIPEDKKEFNIETVRRCISDIELRPYEGKQVYILRQFSTASLSAQNALLKILEECPPYAVILMEVESSNILLETIRSRSIDLVSRSIQGSSYSITPALVRAYRDHDHHEIARLLFELKCTSDEAISILRGVYPHMLQDDMIRCDRIIESLSTTHENPRSLLDIFFL